MSETTFSRSTGMTPARLEALADGIFAFAMTLLVLSVNLPDPKIVTNVQSFLFSQLENFWNFALSFLLLALFWLQHSQQFHHIKKTDSVILLINVVLLLFVALMPFSTSLMSDFTNSRTAEVFFNSNMLILSILLTLNWGYAYKMNFIERGVNEKHIAAVNRKGLVAPAVTLLAFITAFIYPGKSTYFYILIPVFLFFPASRK